MTDRSRYVKARDTDLGGQRYNRSVFVRGLRANPRRSIILSGLFVALGIGLLLVPYGAAAPTALLAAIAFGVAGWLISATFRGS